METLTRLVSESMARHGFDRPVDYRRLQWSRWFRCESHHSLLVVPSKPGVFALAEEITHMATGSPAAHVATAASTAYVETAGSPALSTVEWAVPRTLSEAKGSGAAPEAASRDSEYRRMLAVTRFFEDDDMAFTLDRMLSYQNPMRTRLASGRYFVRFVEIRDSTQRRSICSALNQWIASSTEKATGIGGHFATSLELAPETPSVPRSHRSETPDSVPNPAQCDEKRAVSAPRLNSAVATTIHCSSSFPSGF
jgi:hypothetical protein